MFHFTKWLFVDKKNKPHVMYVILLDDLHFPPSNQSFRLLLMKRNKFKKFREIKLFCAYEKKLAETAHVIITQYSCKGFFKLLQAC